jgi:hypothetical protein
LDPSDGNILKTAVWGDTGNDEARAIALEGDSIFVTGGAQSGRSTDVFLSRLDRSTGAVQWTKTTGGKVVGGGGYGVAVGARGVYVAGGQYDFPAGGDAALMRFSPSGDLEWRQIYGLPGFWDWTFDVAVANGRFYAAGVLWQPGAEWYNVLTIAYREDFPVASLTGVAAQAAAGDSAGASAAMSHFWAGDFLKWAQERNPSDPGDSSVTWDGASNSQRSQGSVSVDTADDPPVSQDNAAGALTGLGSDLQSGNYSFVRDYTGVRASLLDDFIRFRYFISHDRLIPQGGYVSVGEASLPLPPPPV